MDIINIYFIFFNLFYFFIDFFSENSRVYFSKKMQIFFFFCVQGNTFIMNIKKRLIFYLLNCKYCFDYNDNKLLFRNLYMNA